MKLQRTTWALLATAIVLGGGIYLLEMRAAQQQAATQEAAKRKIFEATEDQIQRLVIEKENQTLEFERTEDETAPWQMKQPEPGPASEASIVFLLDLLVEERSDRVLTISPDQQAEYGLTEPLATVTIELDDQTTHKLVLGDRSYDGQALYAITDPQAQPEQELAVRLVPIAFQYAVERSLPEWKQAADSATEGDETAQ